MVLYGYTAVLGHNGVTIRHPSCGNLPMQSPTRTTIVNNDNARTVTAPPHARRDDRIWAQRGHCQSRLTRT